MTKCIGFFLILLFLLAAGPAVKAQCSICSRTTQQFGEKPAKALNTGILYLAITPLAIGGIVGYRWWKSYQAEQVEQNPPPTAP